jgi:hypothetical protein
MGTLNICVYWLGLLILTSATRIEPQKCEYSCQTCNESVLACQNLNFNSTVPIEEKNSYKTIVFAGNQLIKLNRPLFGQNNWMLTDLTLRNNSIHMIESTDVFTNLPNLVKLDLSHNRFELGGWKHSFSLNSLSPNLESLLLNNAWFYGLSSVSYLDSIMADKQIHFLLKQSNLNRLKSLELDKNSLVLFNINHENDLLTHFKARSDDKYEDILCLLPDLEHLSLKSNMIEDVYIDHDCIKYINL